MKCEEVRQHWGLYHDSEGDPVLHLQINEHLGNCPACAEWFSQESRFESMLAEKLSEGSATPELWDQVLAHCGLRQPVKARGWWPLFSAVACAAAVLLIVLGWRWLAPGRGEDLSHIAAEWHVRLDRDRDSLPFQSESDLEVEKYLRQRVSFPVRCPPRKDTGFAVRGAGTTSLNGEPAAYLAGDVGANPVSVFILHRDSLEKFPHQLSAVRDGRTHQCREGDCEMMLRVIDRNAVLVVGRVPQPSLEKVLNGYASYPDHH